MLKVNKNSFQANSQTGINLISSRFNISKTLTPRLKIGIMASGKGSNFLAIHNAISNGNLNAEIVLLIVNNTNCGAKEKAYELNIPFRVINHRNYKNREDLDIEIAKEFNSKNVELIVMAGWMRIVTNKLIEAYSGKIINIHPSLLPSFPGINAVEQALRSGVSITGASVHIVDLEVDSGEILIQAALPINHDQDITSLYNKIQELEHIILPLGIEIAANKIRGN